MSDMPLFDESLSREAREEGLDRAGSPLARSRFLAEAQGVAAWLAETGDVTADDVVRYYNNLGIDINLELGPAMGLVFRGSQWTWTGEVRNSSRVGRHAGALRVWRLRPLDNEAGK